MRRSLLAAWVAVGVVLASCGGGSAKSTSAIDGPAASLALDGSVDSPPVVDVPAAQSPLDGLIEMSPDLGAADLATSDQTVSDQAASDRGPSDLNASDQVQSDQVACPAGASDNDCQLCGTALPSSCQQVCPSVNCNVHPVPAECAAVCAGANCCTCTRVVGDIYYWQTPQLRPQCGSACSDMISRWEAYLADPTMVACTTASDCVVVGGQPFWDPCSDRYSTIGYCGRAANAAAYGASPAASLETEFASSCTNHIAADCGPGYPECISGKCVLRRWGCCLCPPDAGTGRGPDVPVTANDGGG